MKNSFLNVKHGLLLAASLATNHSGYATFDNIKTDEREEESVQKSLHVKIFDELCQEVKTLNQSLVIFSNNVVSQSRFGTSEKSLFQQRRINLFPNTTAIESLENKKKMLDEMFPNPALDFGNFCKLFNEKENVKLLEDILNAEDKETVELKDYLKAKLKFQLESDANDDQTTVGGLNLTAYKANLEHYLEDLLDFLDKLFGAELNQIKLCLMCSVPKHQLQEYPYQPCHELTDATLIRIIQNFPRLKSLRLGFCPNAVTDQLFTELNRSGGYQDLEVLFLAYCPGGKLDAKGACRIQNPECVTEFVRMHSNLLQFWMHTPNEAFTDDFIEALIKNCKNLQTLIFGYWEKDCLTNVSEKDLKKLSKLEQLEKLSIWSTGCLTLNALREIISNCKNLKILAVGASSIDTEDNKQAIQDLLKELNRQNLKINGSKLGEISYGCSN